MVRVCLLGYCVFRLAWRRFSGFTSGSGESVYYYRLVSLVGRYAIIRMVCWIGWCDGNRGESLNWTGSLDIIFIGFITTYSPAPSPALMMFIIIILNRRARMKQSRLCGRKCVGRRGEDTTLSMGRESYRMYRWTNIGRVCCDDMCGWNTGGRGNQYLMKRCCWTKIEQGGVLVKALCFNNCCVSGRKCLLIMRKWEKWISISCPHHV